MPGLGLQAPFAAQSLDDTLQALVQREAATRLTNAHLAIEQQQADTAKQRANQDLEEHQMRMKQILDALQEKQDQAGANRIMGLGSETPLTADQTGLMTKLGMPTRTQVTGADYNGPATGLGPVVPTGLTKVNLRPYTEKEESQNELNSLTPEQTKDPVTMIKLAAKYGAPVASVVDAMNKPAPKVNPQQAPNLLANGKPVFFDPQGPSGPRYVNAAGEDVSDRVTHVAPASAAPPTPETVQSYIKQLKTGAMTFTQIPGKETKDAVSRQLQTEGYDLTQPISTQTRSMAEMARGVLPNLDKVVALAQQVQQAIPAGSIGGRLRSWAAGESVGADLAGLTPAQRTLVGQFITESGLLKSAVARAHGGARGGGSISMLETLDPLLEPGNKDLDTYLGNLRGARDFMNIYAQGDKQPGLTGGKDAPAAPETKVDPRDPMGILKGGGG